MGALFSFLLVQDESKSRVFLLPSRRSIRRIFVQIRRLNATHQIGQQIRCNRESTSIRNEGMFLASVSRFNVKGFKNVKRSEIKLDCQVLAL